MRRWHAEPTSRTLLTGPLSHWATCLYFIKCTLVPRCIIRFSRFPFFYYLDFLNLLLRPPNSPNQSAPNNAFFFSFQSHTHKNNDTTTPCLVAYLLSYYYFPADVGFFSSEANASLLPLIPYALIWCTDCTDHVHSTVLRTLKNANNANNE